MKILSMLTIVGSLLFLNACNKDTVGVGAKAPAGAEELFQGSAESLNENWIYWEGPRFSAEMPISWELVEDPVDGGTVMNSNDPAAEGGKYGSADIVTKNVYRDFRLHVEFLIEKPGGS